MKKRRLKNWVVYSLFVIAFIFVFGSIFLLETSTNVKLDDDISYVSKTIFDKEKPVVATDNLIMRPYIDGNVKILKDYYDYTAESNKQVNAILYYENTYLQNS